MDQHKSLGGDCPPMLNEHRSFKKIESLNYVFIIVTMTIKVLYYLLSTLAAKMILPKMY